MADSPPPLDDVEISQEEEKSEEPLFKPDPEPEAEEPLFADMEQPEEKTVVIEQPEPVPAPTLEATAADPEPPKPKREEPAATSKSLDLFADEEDKMEAEVCSLLGGTVCSAFF